MKDIHIDTVKIKESGNQLIQIAVQLNENVDKMFNRINNMPKMTLEWTGSSAEDYVTKANIDKKQYITFINELYLKGKYLVDYADAMEQKLKEVIQ